jgi:hypothetical protein
MAADDARVAAKAARMGIGMIAPSHGLAALDAVIRALAEASLVAHAGWMTGTVTVCSVLPTGSGAEVVPTPAAVDGASTAPPLTCIAVAIEAEVMAAVMAAVADLVGAAVDPSKPVIAAGLDSLVGVLDTFPNKLC